jgi:dsDNA-specific endonuclease/ATPase MutS2
MRYLDLDNREKIGFEYILSNLSTISPYGQKKKREIKPILDLELLNQELDHLEEFKNQILTSPREISKLDLLLMKLKDITNVVLNLEKSKILDEVELFELKVNTMILLDLRVFSNSLFPKEYHLGELEKIVEILDPQGKNIPTFHLYSEYSLKLKEIREDKSNIEKLIFSATDREEQDELREQRREIVVLEGEEESKIKIQLSEKLVKYSKLLLETLEKIGRIDFILAKAKLALKYNSTRPIIGDKIEFIGMFNPEILDLLKTNNQEFQRLDILLEDGNTFLTGANMGGKSVVLKTLTLNLMLGQMGFYVFAEYAVLPQLDFIKFLSDDVQDTSKGLSSFGGEIVRLKEITALLKHFSRGFIALDEFARGTNPNEGKKFVEGLAEYINKFKSFSIMATHYDGVVKDGDSHYQVVGLKNINFEDLKRKIDLNSRDSISLIQKHMDYSIEKIESELEVPKDALNIATLIGIEEELLKVISGK